MTLIIEKWSLGSFQELYKDFPTDWIKRGWEKLIHPLKFLSDSNSKHFFILVKLKKEKEKK